MMKRMTRLLLPLMLALLMLFGVACSAVKDGADAEPAKTEQQKEETNENAGQTQQTEQAQQEQALTPARSLTAEECDLLGTWMIIDGSGEDYLSGYVSYHTWNQGEIITFYYDSANQNMGVVYDFRLFSSYSKDYGHAEVGKNGTFASKEIDDALNEKSKMSLTFSYQLEDAPECDSFLWEHAFAPWSDLRDKSADVVKKAYHQDKKDRMVLHITGQEKLSELENRKVDVTLTLVKILPLFFHENDLMNLHGTWMDDTGRKWEFGNGNNDTILSVKMTNAEGVVYTGQLQNYGYHEITGEGLCACPRITLDSEAGDRIWMNTKNITFDGNKVIITGESGTEIILSPMA